MQHSTQQDFADQLRIAPATLSSIFTGRTRPTLAIVDAIKNRFPQISTDWLMFGKGDMLETHDAESESTTTQDTEKNDLLADFDTNPPQEQSNTKAEQPVQPSVSGFAVKTCEARQRRITEIRVFYDDQTWETFVPSV